MTKASDKAAEAKVTSTTDDGTPAVTVTPGEEPAGLQAVAATSGGQPSTSAMEAAGVADSPPAVDSNGVEHDPPVDKLHVTMTRQQKIDAGVCVVPDGESSTPHVGRAVNGLVCSAHAMHYDAQGRRRDAVAPVTVAPAADVPAEDVEVK